MDNREEKLSTMRAARLYDIRDIRVEDVPRPTPGPGEVLLRIASVGVCGSDVHYYLDGRIGDQVVTAPIVIGHEFSAWITELGPGVEDLEIGQLVAVEPGVHCGKCESCQTGHPNLCPNIRFFGTPPFDGIYVEYVAMPAENCFPLPEGFSPADGAMLEPLGIAIHSVSLARMKPGQTAAVLGAGPIGLLTAAVAKVSGADTVYMTEPLAYRRQFALNYVADAALNPNEEGTDVIAQIKRLTGGRGVDVAFEAAGAPETPNQAGDLARLGGKVIFIGTTPEDTMTLTPSIFRRKGLTVKWVRRMQHTYPRAIRLVKNGLVDVKSMVTHTFPLERTGDAFEMVSTYQDNVLKAMIEVVSA
jgi:L-iditol 2-dehydrogenase